MLLTIIVDVISQIVVVTSSTTANTKMQNPSLIKLKTNLDELTKVNAIQQSSD